MPITAEEYDASFTADAVVEFREHCRATAAAWIAAGVDATDAAVAWQTVEVQRRFLGFPVTDRYRESEVLLRGWQLAEVTTLHDTTDDLWRLRTVAVVLGDDGELYRVERRREEKAGHPTADDGAAHVTRLADADLPLWDHLDPPSFGAGTAPGYWALFPERLRAALAELDGTR